MSVLAWRSYVLSVRTERGTATLAQQYAAYAADITARRMDNAVRNESARAAEDWQQVEKKGPVTAAALSDWMGAHDWITAALFVPDADPGGGIYVNISEAQAQTTAEFYTSNGVIRYYYSPVRLLARVKPVVQLPAGATRELSKQAQIGVRFGAL